MPVPSSINDLSTTPGSNGPAGSESPAVLDDYQRTHASYIALIRESIIGGYATAGGTANALTLSINRVPLKYKSGGSYVQGDKVRARVPVTNTGAMTLSVDGLSAVAVKTVTGADTPAGYIRTDVDTEFTFNGTHWVAGRQAERGSNANGMFWRYADGTLEMTRTATVNTSVTDSSANYDYPASPFEVPDAGSIVPPPTLNATVNLDARKVSVQLQLSNWRTYLSGTGTSGNQEFKLYARARWY